MSSYLRLLNYSDKFGIDLKMAAEQNLINKALHDHYAKEQSVIEKNKITTRWDSKYQHTLTIWKLLPVLYKDDDFGTIKYIPKDQIEEYKKRIVLLIKFYTSDVKNLIEEGTSELEMLIDFYHSLNQQTKQNTHILFSLM